MVIMFLGSHAAYRWLAVYVCVCTSGLVT